jgi:hypothetical protein
VVERLHGRVRELESIVVPQKHVIAEQRIGSWSCNVAWGRIPRRRRVHRRRRRRGISSREETLVEEPAGPAASPASSRVDPDETFEVAADHCARCEKSLDDALETARVRHQVVDVKAPPPPKITEYQLVSRRCGGCGRVSDPTTTDVPRPVDPGSDVVPSAASVREAASNFPVGVILPSRSWHEAYRKFGTNPRRIRPSVDALHRRLASQGRLPV